MALHQGASVKSTSGPRGQERLGSAGLAPGGGITHRSSAGMCWGGGSWVKPWRSHMFVCWATGASFSSLYRVLPKGVRAAAGTGKDAELLFASTTRLKRANLVSRVCPGNWAAIAPLCLSFPTWKGYRCLHRGLIGLRDGQ